MNNDARIAVSFRSHPKRIKLLKRLGAEGVLAFVDLVLFTAQSKPDGRLTAMTREDVEIAAQWAGEPGRLLAALVEVGLLDSEGQCFALHDWLAHNSYAAKAPQRSVASSRAAHIRWLKVHGTSCEDKTCQHCRPHARRMRAASKRIAPVPAPVPAPEPKEREPFCAFDREEEFTKAFDHDYPRAQGRNVGRTDARKAFDRTVKTAADLADFQKAMTNYKAIPDVRNGYVLKAPKFFAKWREDYLHVQAAGRHDVAHGDTVREEGIRGVAL